MPEYWTGDDWDRDSTRAKSFPFRAAVDTLVYHRGDPAQREFSFGVIPDGLSTTG